MSGTNINKAPEKVEITPEQTDIDLLKKLDERASKPTLEMQEALLAKAKAEARKATAEADLAEAKANTAEAKALAVKAEKPATSPTPATVETPPQTDGKDDKAQTTANAEDSGKALENIGNNTVSWVSKTIPALGGIAASAWAAIKKPLSGDGFIATFFRDTIAGGIKDWATGMAKSDGMFGMEKKIGSSILSIFSAPPSASPAPAGSSSSSGEPEAKEITKKEQKTTKQGKENKSLPPQPVLGPQVIKTIELDKTSMNRSQIIQRILPLAKEVERQYNIPHLLVLAQYFQETGNKTQSEIASRGFGVFNITAGRAWKEGIRKRPDTDGAGKKIMQNFRTYPGLYEAFMGYGEFMSKEYSGVVGKTAKISVHHLKKPDGRRYAEDLEYENKLLNIMKGTEQRIAEHKPEKYKTGVDRYLEVANSETEGQKTVKKYGFLLKTVDGKPTVKTKGIKESTLAITKKVFRTILGYQGDIIFTSLCGHSHKKGSKHYKGEAADIRTKGKHSKIFQLAESLGNDKSWKLGKTKKGEPVYKKTIDGYQVKVIAEAKGKSNEHVHISVS